MEKELNLQEMLDMLKTTEYTEFLRILKNADGSSINYEDHKIYVNTDRHQYIIVPPVVINVDDKLDEYKKKLYGEYRQYNDIYYDILNSDTPNEAEYTSIVERIRRLEKNMNTLTEYLYTVNDDTKLSNTIEEESAIRKEKETEVEAILENRKKLSELRVDISKEKAKVEIRYYIEKAPEITERGVRRSRKTVSTAQVQTIRSNVKNLIREKFKFTSLEECISKRSTQPYYMSKPDIIKEIDRSNVIKTKMPSGYKRLSKDDLCRALFDIKL